MAGQVLKKRRLINAAGRRRRMTLKQIRFFGTKRQKANLRNRARKRPRHGRRRNQGGLVSSATHAAERAIKSVERAAEDAIDSVTSQVNRGRRKNVGEILTVVPANPGRRRKKMATSTKRRRNRSRVSNRRYRRRSRAAVHNRRRHRHRNPKVVVRYRNRRRRNYGRRRNQGIGGRFLGGDAGKVVAILGGATVTGVITGMLPSTWKSGVMGYVTTGAVAVITGNVAGRALGNKSLGNWMTIGGLLIVGLNLLQQVFPNLQLPFTSGMGLITSSNFFVPQVNMPGSMATFVPPAAIPQVAPVVVPAGGMNGLGAQPVVGLRSLRRIGRMR